MDRLRFALDHPSTVDSRTAELVESATSRLFDLQHHSPSRLLAPTVERHLGTVTALLTAARHEGVRRRLMSSAGRGAALAGWLAFDRGDIASAHRYWDTSIGAAEGTVDAPLLAASLTFLSYAAARRGDPGTAWQLSHTASQHTPDDPPRHRVGHLPGRAARRASSARTTPRGPRWSAPSNWPETCRARAPATAAMPWTRSFDRARLLLLLRAHRRTARDPHAADYAARAVESWAPPASRPAPSCSPRPPSSPRCRRTRTLPRLRRLLGHADPRNGRQRRLRHPLQRRPARPALLRHPRRPRTAPAAHPRCTQRP